MSVEHPPVRMGLPDPLPPGWPTAPTVYPASIYGPAGTGYLFSEADVLAAQHPDLLRLLRELSGSVWADGSGYWSVPMQWMRLAIHAALGQSEQMVHVLNLGPHGPAPGADLPTDGVGLRAVLDQLAPIITTWATGTNGFTGPDVRYDGLAISVMEQTTATNKDGSGGDLRTVVPTEPRALVVPAGIDSSHTLPYEVACALTLTTRQAGRSGKGRVFLGGLTTSALATNGMYSTLVEGVASDFATKVLVAIRQTTPWEVVICSRRTLKLWEVTGVKVGKVPDSQRRRRGLQNENYVGVWQIA